MSLYCMISMMIEGWYTCIIRFVVGIMVLFITAASYALLLQHSRNDTAALSSFYTVI